MTTITFFYPSEVETFIDWAIENDLSYQQDETGMIWTVSDEFAQKIQEQFPHYDYWTIEKM